MSRLLSVLSILLVAVSCAGGWHRSRSPVGLDGSWDDAKPALDSWVRGSRGRGFATQDLDASPRRLHAPLDSLFMAQSDWRRAGGRGESSAVGAAAEEAGKVVREHYIFYLRGNFITGIEYRAVVANGRGGYRQVDHAMGEAPGSPPGRT